jgi:hypothetical protein
MKLVKTIGGVLIFVAGYLAHIVADSSWTLTGKIYVGIFVVLLIHLGVAAILSKNTKSLKENIADALAWPLSLFP